MNRAILLSFLTTLTAFPTMAEGLPPATPLVHLSANTTCSRCEGTALPGRVVAQPAAKWGIISDLPESFKGYGVLYSTADMLPPNGAPDEMRRQIRAENGPAAGFRGIDGGFDVFLFHLNKTAGATQRIVVYARNLGTSPATVKPRQVIKSEGLIGTVHDFESELGARVLKDDWDRPLQSVVIPSGQGRVVGYGRVFGAGAKEGPDSRANVNCFGYVRAELAPPAAGTAANLLVEVIAIPATPIAGIDAEAAKWTGKGVESTDEVSMTGPPQGCALGRAVGTYPNFAWMSDIVTVDATTLTDGGTTFPIGLPAVQTPDCPEARQTQDFALRPGYTRFDTVGNYMVPYETRFILTNPGATDLQVDLTMGKQGADIGLAYAVASAPFVPGNATPEDSFKKLSIDPKDIKTQWAGPKQASKEKTMLPRPVTVAPGKAVAVRARFMILGNSSLPFTLAVKPVK